ncbi:MAG TPA: M3 family oligoendopeptidase [Vampirovibrionales bacterium]
MNTATEVNKEVLPSWDLSDLYKAIDDPNINKDIESSFKRAIAFKEKYAGKLSKISANDLVECIEEYDQINELAEKAIYYAHLLHSADSSKPEHGSLLSKLQEKCTEISEYLTFFSLEWNTLEDSIVNKLLSDDVLAKYRHYLKETRKSKPYQLSEKEEIVIQKVDLTNRPAWTRLFDETIGRMKFKVKTKENDKWLEKELSEEETLSLLYSADREVRANAAEALTIGLKQEEPLLTYIFNVLTQEHAIEDKLRGYPNPMRARNMANEITDEAVEALMTATEKKVGLVERFYKLKKQLMGLDEMLDYDRYAPLPFQADKKWTWTEAKDFVISSYAEFSPQFADICTEFCEKNWIDADLREGKRGGAFSAGVVASVHPYILVNFTGTSRDVSTLAHELGHGIHQYLSRKVGNLEADTPLTTAETASVFGEMLNFDRLVAQANDDKERLALLVTKIDEIIATVFRQVYMTRFEHELHTERREKGELTCTQINELWNKQNKKMFGNSVKLTDNYSYWWLYISHFIHSPFYCYAYAFGLLLSITLYNQSKTRGKEFKEKYTQILSLGGSVEPVELLKIADVDISDPDFWMNGFKLVEDMIAQAEELAKKVSV